MQLMNAWCGSGDFPGGGGGRGGGVETYLASEYLYGATIQYIGPTLLEIVPSLNIVFEVSKCLKAWKLNV